MTDVRALSLWQPWASLVAVGAKTIETRRHRTHYRGRLLIHAAKRIPTPERGPMFVGDFHVAQGGTWLHGPGVDVPMAFGAVVASCELLDCVPMVADYDEVASSYDGPAALEVTSNGTLLLYPAWDSALYDEQIRNVTAEAPFGDFSPGRFAWLLGDVKPTTERCPRCWGDGYEPGHGPTPVGGGLSSWRACPTCATDENPVRGAGTCEPVPMRGRQGLWRPTWEVAPG